MVPGSVDADWDVCLEAEAGLANRWVPLVELCDCEVAERLGNAEAGVRRLDSVEGRTVGGADSADLENISKPVSNGQDCPPTHPAEFEQYSVQLFAWRVSSSPAKAAGIASGEHTAEAARAPKVKRVNCMMVIRLDVNESKDGTIKV